MPDIEIVPPSLTAAAGPLHDAATLLTSLANDRTGLEQLANGSPDEAFRTALREFVEAWELVLWDLASHADGLADELRRCAEDYVEADNELARGAAALTPDWGWHGLR